MPSPGRPAHTPGAAGVSACCATGHIPSLFLFSSRLGLPKLSRLTLNSYVTQADLKLQILWPYPPKMPRWFARATRQGWVPCTHPLCLWEEKRKHRSLAKAPKPFAFCSGFKWSKAPGQRRQKKVSSQPHATPGGSLTRLQQQELEAIWYV